MKKYFIPNKENEYKPHVMRKTSVAVIAFLALFIFFIGYAQHSFIQKGNFLSAVIPESLVELANGDRAQNQLSMLVVNPLLVKAAQEKADDMAKNGYFAHTSPFDSAKNPWFWFKGAGYDFVYAGENLAVNFSDSVDVNGAWMNSPGHRANILNGKFTEIGIATAKGFYKGQETIFVVQMFGRPQTKIALTVPVPKKPVLTKATTSTTTLQAKLPVAGVSTTSTSTVLSATAENAQKVLAQSETFIAVENVAKDTSSQVITGLEPAKTSWLERMMVSPKKTTSILFLFLATFVLISLLIMIGIEFKHQHMKLVAFGVGLLVLILTLSYIYRTFLIAQVIVV